MSWGKRFEHGLENLLFASRWILAPIYLGLGLSLLLLLGKFGAAAWKLVLHGLDGNDDHLIVGILGLIDISLMANLIIMVVFAGYENFVSRFDLGDHPDRPDWMGHVGFSEIKLKLMTSIVAISAIHVLEDFMNVASVGERQLAWRAGLHLLFVVSAVMLAWMDRIMTDGKR